MSILDVRIRIRNQTFYKCLIRSLIRPVEPRAVDPHCFLMRIRSRIRIQLKILMRIRIQIRGGGGRSAKNVHPPWQNPRYAPASCYPASVQLFFLFSLKLVNLLQGTHSTQKCPSIRLGLPMGQTCNRITPRQLSYLKNY
jgi:hypothetical protein